MNNPNWNESDLVEALRTDRASKAGAIVGVLWSSFFNWFSDGPWAKVGILSGAIVGVVAVQYFRFFLQAVWAVLSWHSFLVSEFIGFILLGCFYGTIRGLFKRVKRVVNPERFPLVEGVPLPEVLNHLFKYGTFKREGEDGVKKKLGLGRGAYDRLVSLMSSKGMISHSSDKNAYMLNSDWTREQVSGTLATYAGRPDWNVSSGMGMKEVKKSVEKAITDDKEGNFTFSTWQKWGLTWDEWIHGGKEKMRAILHQRNRAGFSTRKLSNAAVDSD